MRLSWNQEDDEALKILVQDRKISKWSSIATLLEKEFKLSARTGKQCSERWNNHLRPNLTFKNSWDAQQQEILFKNYLIFGGKWSRISKALPGRSNNNIKNHFYSSLRKSIRRLNKFIKKYYLSKIKEQIQMTQLYTILQIFNTKFSDRIEFSVETIQDCCQIIKSLIEYININPLKLNKCERESITILIQSIHKFGKLIDKNQLKQQNSEDLSTLVQNQIKNTSQLCTLQKSNSDSTHDYSKCDDSQNLFYFYNQINYQTIDQIEMPFNCQLDMGYIDFNDELYL